MLMDNTCHLTLKHKTDNLQVLVKHNTGFISLVTRYYLLLSGDIINNAASMKERQANLNCIYLFTALLCCKLCNKQLNQCELFFQLYYGKNVKVDKLTRSSCCLSSNTKNHTLTTTLLRYENFNLCLHR